jgi:hypothetical protein
LGLEVNFNPQTQTCLLVPIYTNSFSLILCARARRWILGYGFFHKGKVATYTIDAGIYGGIKEVQLKAGKFAEVNFARAWVWVNF